jgi:hypothetical protein
MDDFCGNCGAKLNLSVSKECPNCGWKSEVKTEHNSGSLIWLVILGFLIVGGFFLISYVFPLAQLLSKANVETQGTIPFNDGDLVVDYYNASFSESLTLSEHYEYVIKNSGKYRMLYRTWDTPLVTAPINQPSIQFISMQNPQSTTGYLKDNNGAVTIVGTGGKYSQIEEIRKLADNNEEGIYNALYFDAGTYTAEYVSNLRPPIEYDSNYAHLNIKLAGQSHIPYNNVRITFPAKYVIQVFPHPSRLRVNTIGDQIVITGQVAKDETLGVEILLKRDALLTLDGFPTAVNDVKGRTLQANNLKE